MLLPLPGGPTLCNPTILFYIINKEPLDCVSFKLFEDKVPKRAENFCVLSNGEKGYKGSSLKIILELMCQCGDFICPNGSSPVHLQEKFADENFTLKQGILASCPWKILDPRQMVPCFFICIAKTEQLDSRCGLWQGKRDISAIEDMSTLGLGVARPATSPCSL